MTVPVLVSLQTISNREMYRQMPGIRSALA